jgi:photosystem II stability/assembly factor-like uncharacterized protein
MKNLICIIFLCIQFLLFAQVSTPSLELINGINLQNELIQNSIVKNLEFRNIGPSVMSGRVTDIEVNPEDSTEFYIAYASGGLWHTINNGTTFNSIFDNANTQNIGDFDVDWNNRIIIVGTGENNSSRSSYAGIGILRSSDNGKNWENIGLTDSHHIGKVKINPNNSNEIIVGVLGHLYSTNMQRGIFKTINSGKTWTKKLEIDEKTGIIDIDIDPQNFNIQYASSWEKERASWDFIGNGSKSGIYKSIDAGESWELISTKESGFPSDSGVGRIGISVFDKNTVYAIVDNQSRRSKEKEIKRDGIDKNIFENMSVKDFIALNDKLLNDFLENNGFPKKYDATTVKNLVSSNEIEPLDLKLFLEDANTVMFDTPIIGAEVYRSDNGGKTWIKKNSYYLDRLYNTYGYYFGRIHVSPTNKDHIYVYGVPIIKSIDGGITYKSIDYQNVHADHHDLWINPKNPDHLINGNDGGMNMSYDGGKNWSKLNQPSVGQFYSINVDYEKPYNVYGGLQDNGVWMAPGNSVESARWHQTGHNNWTSIGGGDGMQVQIDNRDSNIIYTGSQFGVYFRLNKKTGKRHYLKPKHDLGESPLRFNWQTPILLSLHNQDIFYLGSNKLHVSLNKGDDWTFKSMDLTKGVKQGNVPYGTLSTIDESIFKFGKLVVGSDDGLIHLSKDGGNTWDLISNDLPQNLWVSRVIFSKHHKNRIYATLNGYRYDDFKPYVFISDDNGKNWKTLSNKLPISSVNVIKEDPFNENLIYLGTDNGAYISFDNGDAWWPFSNGLNKVAVHDLVIQSEAKELLLGTHGRSIYKTDLSIIYNYLNKREVDKDGIVYTINDINYSNRWGSRSYNWSEYNEPKLKFYVFSNTQQTAKVKLINNDGLTILKKDLDLKIGFQEITLEINYSKEALKSIKKRTKVEIKKADNEKYYFKKGDYKLFINKDSESFQIK